MYELQDGRSADVGHKRTTDLLHMIYHTIR